MKSFPPDLCPLCGGNKQLGTATFTVDLGFGVVVIRRVPATVCSQCGAEWIGDAAAAQIERSIEDARAKHSEIEVLAFS